MNATIMVTAAGATTAGAGIVVGAVAPTDWAGVAQVITAFGTVLVAVGTVITAFMQARQKRDGEETKADVQKTKTAIEETREVMRETKAAVDGGMTKLLDAKVAEASAQATLDEQAVQRERKGIEDAATLKEKERAAATAPPPVPATPAPPGSPLKPVPVEVVNAGDTSLKVTEDKPK